MSVHSETPRLRFASVSSSVSAAVARLGLALLLAVVTGVRPAAADGTPADSAYQQFRGTAEHHDPEFRHGFNPDNVTSAWTYDPAGDGLTSGFDVESQPCVSADSRMVFAVGDVDSTTSKIIAVDADTGNKAWEITVPAHNSFGSKSSPVFHRGYVYWVGSDGSATATAFRIRASDGSTATADGGWQVTLPFANDVVNATAVVADCRLFVTLYGGFTPGVGKTLALRLGDGAVDWVAPDGGDGQGAPAYIPDRGLVAQAIFDPVASADAGDNRFRVRGYEAATGAVAWTTAFVLNHKYSPHAAIVHANDRLYLVSTDFAASTLYCIRADNGALDWSADFSLSSTGVPAIDPDGNVYVCGEDFAGTNQTLAFDANGQAIAAWSGNGTATGANGLSVTWADDMVLIGTTSDTLAILDDSDGSQITTLAGKGPAAFGFNRLYSIDANGVLQAHTCGSLFAGSVVRYAQGSTNTPSFNNPATALGRPTTTTDGQVAAEVVVHGAMPPQQTDELVSIGVGGELVLKFDQPVQDDPANPFGIDFIVFGNAFMGAGGPAYADQTDPTTFTLDGTIFAEPATVEVSADGVNWVTVSPKADHFAPTLGRVYDEGNPDASLGAFNLWWSAVETDPHLPLDPALTAADFNSQTVAQMAQTYGQSAGGTGFDISGSGLARVRYLRITTDAADGGSASEIDAVAIVRPAADTTAPPVVTDLSATITDGTARVSCQLPDDGDVTEVMIVRSIGSNGTAPTDGIHYCPGQVLGTAVVVHVGALADFTESGVGTEPLPTYTVYTVDRALNHSGGVEVVAVIGSSNNGGGSGSGGGCAAGTAGNAITPLALFAMLLGLWIIRRRR